MVKKLRYAIGILVVLILAGGGYGYYFLTCPCSEKEREVKAPLKGRAEVIRDEMGVPHIFAENEHDLFFAMGYVVASDRLFQMDLTRRASLGDISEILGEDYVDYDYFIRSMGLRKSSEMKAEEISGEPKLISDAFCAGVNHYITTHKGRLPLEFTLLGYEPRLWTPVDIYSVALYMAYDLSQDYDAELLRYRLSREVEEDLIGELFPPYPEGFDIQIPEYGKSPAFSIYDDSEIKSMLGWGGAHGSNNWVVSGEKTGTGYPILCNDPHLGLDEPSIWYEVHLVGAGFNVYGTTIPGVPAIIIGHNEDIAWGVTNVGADVQDLYIEKINPQDENQYWYIDHWEDMETEKTIINVKGKPSITKEILYTIHGPVVSDEKEEQVLALQWTAHFPSQELEAFLGIGRAHDFEEFREGLKFFTVPSQNFVYADREGTIAYVCNGRIPIRKKGMGMFPVDGSTGEYGWEGFIPFEELPQIKNPTKGFIVTSNVKVVPDTYPYYLFYNYAPPYRFQRIVNMLSSKGKVDKEYMKAIQNDVYSLQASLVVPEVLPLLEGNDEDISVFREELKKWDFNATPESRGASVFFAFMLNVLEETYKDDLGELYGDYLKQQDFTSQAFTRIMEEDSIFFDRKDTLQIETKKDIVNMAARKTVKFLEDNYGNDYAWGSLHTITFDHPIGSAKPLNLIYNIGPFASPGGSDTVNNGEFSFGDPFSHTSGPSLRMIVDFSNMGEALLTITTGQSGSPFCENYKNMTELWLKGEYHTMLFTEKDIRAHATRVLWLIPG